jgi:hypothetical protein
MKGTALGSLVFHAEFIPPALSSAEQIVQRKINRRLVLLETLEQRSMLAADMAADQLLLSSIQMPLLRPKRPFMQQSPAKSKSIFTRQQW